ncbi:MAG: M28 family peptidase, partial [Holophagales bacterium]|nr:M28 family peptidase [Holophagales bacterium]
MIGRDLNERTYNQMAFRFGYDVKNRPYSAEEAANLVMGTSSAQAAILNKLVVDLNQDHVGLALIASSQKNISGGTDYRPFHASKIPVLGFFTGFHDDYHQPTDTAEKINVKKIGKIARLAFLVAYEVADGEEKPGWVDIID